MRPRGRVLAALALAVPGLAQRVVRNATIIRRTTISTSVFLPFTDDDGNVPEASTFLEHAISAVMAADHFNSKDGTLVPAFATRCSTVTLNVSDVWNTFGSRTSEFITDLLPQLQLCTDDPDWYYGTNPGNTCEYVGRLVNADGSLKRCDEKNTDGERNALQACPQTCDSCDQALPEDRAIAGPLASGVSGFLSNLADVYEIPVISHASTSPELDNEAIYGNFMRTVPSDEDLAKAYCAWCLENNWRSIGVIAVDDLFGRGIGSAIQKKCDELGIKATPRYFIGSVVPDALERAMTNSLQGLPGTRIYFLVVTTALEMETMGRLAIEMGRTGPEYAWTTQITDPAAWDPVNQTIARSFFPGFARIDISGIAPDKEAKFRRAYAAQDPKRFAYFGKTAGEAAVPTQAYIDRGVESTYSGFMYDAVAAIGLGACARDEVASQGDTSDDLTLLAAMQQARFDGVSGSVEFDPRTGSRPGNSSIYIIEDVVRNGTSWEYPKIGTWTEHSGWRFSEDFIFYDGTTIPPLDGFLDFCPPGQFFENDECFECPAGTSQANNNNRNGRDSCIPCRSDEYSSKGAAACSSCPENSHINENRTARQFCVCDDGYYATEWPIEDKCHDCPSKATCAGGLTGPYPDEDHWLDPLDPPDEKLRSYQCRYNWICRGGTAPATCQEADWLPEGVDCVEANGRAVTLRDSRHWCARGWDSETPTCSGEIQGDYWYLDTQAIRCPPRGKVVFSVGMMIGILVLFFAINEIRPHYPVFDVVLMSYQDLGIITLYYFDWNRNLAQLFFIFRVALFDVDVVEPTCSFDWGFTQAFTMMLALPPMFAVVQVCGYILKLKKWDQAYAGTLSFFVDAQASLLYYCISSYICRRIQPAGHFVVVVDPTTSCLTDSMTTMRVIAAIYLGVIIAVSLGLFWRVWSAARADELRSPHVLVRYGFMYRRFRLGASFWGAARMVKQALLVVILNWWDSPEEQAVFSMLVLAIYAAAAAWIRPDTDLLVNRTELAGVGISGFAVVLGLSFTANNRKSSTSLKFGSDTRYLLYFVVAQLIFLAGAIRATAINVSAVRARKSVETRVKALHLAVVKTRRHGRLLNEASQRQMELSFSDSGDSSVRFRSADSSIKGRIRRQVGRHVRRMSPLKRSKSLSAAQAQQLAGHGREIEETEGRLEVLHTFRAVWKSTSELGCSATLNAVEPLWVQHCVDGVGT